MWALVYLKIRPTHSIFIQKVLFGGHLEKMAVILVLAIKSIHTYLHHFQHINKHIKRHQDYQNRLTQSIFIQKVLFGGHLEKMAVILDFGNQIDPYLSPLFSAYQ